MTLPRVLTSASLVASLLIGGSMLPRDAHAQIRASELQSIAQTVDGTTIRLTYSRPRVRGRWPVFGTRIVEWGEVWTPGANWATTLELNKDARIGGIAVPKGKYSVWMIVRKDSAWTMLLDPKWHQFHMDHPTPNATHVQIPLRMDSVAMEDVLTWTFPSVQARGGTMAMTWARTRASVDFSVTPTLSELLAEAEARPYVGTYTIKESTPGAEPSRMIVTYDQEGLRARFDPNDDYLKTFALIRVGPDIFTAGLFDRSGSIYEVLKPDMMFTFSRVGGRPMSFEVRGLDDTVEFTGQRIR